MTISLPHHDQTITVNIRIAPDAGALARLHNGQLTAAILKGTAEQTGITMTPSIQVADQILTAPAPGDLLHGTPWS